ncbi:LAETG motif-containing sortase-dependent surface protein [Streptomyces hydrogenans]|uniref:LAETG motif-containing sortase-dependent surface protein n=1 Tax=Streptomyces hydrogenans TaxID=1873719 RepID=UPI0035D5E406
MKIRRILATAVAAAVTTPVVLLSAGPAFADTPKPATSKGAAAQQDDLDGPDFEELERLEAAYAAAEQKVEDLKAEREQVKNDLLAGNLGKEVVEELAAAEKAVADAKTARTAAEAVLTAAKEALTAIEADAAATPEQKTAAAEAVTTAEAEVAEAVTAATAADERLARATTAWNNARVALAQKGSLLAEDIKAAEQELAAAEAAVDAFWEDKGDFEECVEDGAVRSTLTGPKTITIGSSANFSLTVKNTSDRDLDSVRSYLFAAQLPESWEDIDEEHPDLDRYFDIDWKTAANPKWTELDFQDDAIELGAIGKGGKVDVTLRLTVDEDAPAGEGIAFTTGEYENEDGSCGISEQYAEVEFDIVEPGAEPEPEETASPSPSPSPSTSAPAPAATSGHTPQGGSSHIPVATGGELAATGSSDVLPQVAAAAGAALVLGAGAVFVARRRKVNA